LRISFLPLDTVTICPLPARRYQDRFGETSSPLIGALSYAALHHYAIAASLAGGTGAPGNFDQNMKIARRLKETIYRSVLGVINFHPLWQSAIPYPDATDDPSLGMPHLFFQIQDHNLEGVLIAPEPYNSGRFRAPPWMI
jgi:branched-chain amino acid transport system substrate-binding protein